MGVQEGTKRRCKWKVRWFYSKGAYLILAWFFLVTVSFFMLMFNIYVPLLLLSSRSMLSIVLVTIVPSTMFIIAAPLSGWIADAKISSLKVQKFGNVLLFLSCLFMCVFTLVTELISSDLLRQVFLCVTFTLGVIGSGAFISTSAQLGLDQMPEASSENIASFLNWHYFVLVISTWLAYVLYVVNVKYVNKEYNLTFYQLLSFFLVFCMSIVLISDFLLSSKNLVMETNVPKSLKTVYQVVKFAWKHKSPLNRSALTYWEEDIPSRLDLGKSRYGGPFTTEQVEDVKSVLRLTRLGMTSLFGYSIFTIENVYSVSKFDYDRPIFVSLSSVKGTWFFVGMLLQEFFVYPLFRSKYPGTLKRLEASYFLIVTVCVVCLILVILNYCGLVSSLSYEVVFSVSSGLLFVVFIPAELEFVCAQTPHYMRGLLIGLVYMKYAFSFLLSWLYLTLIATLCTSDYCSIIKWSVLTGVTTVGFIMFCFVASRYKLRTRDDGFAAQRLIEEIYDRNLTAASRFEQ